MRESALRILLLGHGRMGRLVETLAPSYGVEIAGVLDSRNNAGGAALTASAWRDVDVAIDFSHADAFREHAAALCGLGIDLVIGTTGWKADEASVRRAVQDAEIGAVVSANFSLGANILEALAETAGRLLAQREDYGVWLHEWHHAAKKDAPSGTALMLKAAVERGGVTRGIDVSSTRAGAAPGTHVIGFDGPSESITLEHAVRDRATFAHGALAAARWVKGRRGWFTMRDVIGF